MMESPTTNSKVGRVVPLPGGMLEDIGEPEVLPPTLEELRDAVKGGAALAAPSPPEQSQASDSSGQSFVPLQHASDGYMPRKFWAGAVAHRKGVKPWTGKGSGGRWAVTGLV